MNKYIMFLPQQRESTTHGCKTRILVTSLLLTLLMLCQPSYALQYAISPGSNIVGKIQIIKAAYEDTFISLARIYNVAFSELLAANPGIDPWIPGEGTEIVIPTRYILPPGEHKGIVINLAEMRLYYFTPDGTSVITHPIAVGKTTWPTPIAYTKVTNKKENPSWHVPKSILKEHAARGKPIRKVWPPGPKNPLGKHAIRLGISGYLIHGTNAPDGVGQAISHGCIRMYPEDIAQLFPHIRPGIPVRIIHEPNKIGWIKNKIYVEAHKPLTGYHNSDADAQDIIDLIYQQYGRQGAVLSGSSVTIENISRKANGIPKPVGQGSI